MTSGDLQIRRHEHPFRPFRIRMESGAVFDVLEAWMIVIGESSAIVVTRVRQDDHGYRIAMDWRTVSIAEIAELSNPPDVTSTEFP